MRYVFFHSYKGGVGRSFLLANIAFKLSQLGKNTGIVDLDYDAPGLSHLMFGSMDMKFESREKDMLYLLINNTPGALREAVFTLGDKITMLPTNPAQSPETMESLYQLILDRDGEFEKRLEVILKSYAEIFRIEYLLVDLRPGHSFLLAPLAALSDLAIQIFRLTPQDSTGQKY